MIFALQDYLRFRSLRGRYTPFVGSRADSFRYFKHIPDSDLNRLQDGDFVLMGNHGSLLSWLIMYATDSLFSHVAIYAKGGHIGHHTLEGAKFEPIANYFGGKRVFLPISLPKEARVGGGERPTVEEFFRTHMQTSAARGYNFGRVGMRGITYFFCLNPYGFHMRQYGDLSFMTLVLSVIFWTIGYNNTATTAILILLLIGALQIYWKFRYPLKLYPATPEGMYRFARLKGWPIQMNILGFRRYILKAASLLEKEHGKHGLAEGKTYRLPPGLDMDLFR